ncbi:MAG TPA: hypothetical protein VF607_05780, partial [Verrucomicrobiae bacterium]
MLLQLAALTAVQAQTFWQTSINRSGDYHFWVGQIHNQGFDSDFTYDYRNEKSFGESTPGRVYHKYDDAVSYPYASGTATHLHDTTYLLTASNLLACGSLLIKEHIAAGGLCDANGFWVFSGGSSGTAFSSYDCLVGVTEPTPFTLTATTSPGVENPDFQGHAAFVELRSDFETNKIDFGNFNEPATLHTFEYAARSGTVTGTLLPYHNYPFKAYVENVGFQLGPSLEELHPIYGYDRSVKFSLLVGPPLPMPAFGPLTYTTPAPPRSNYPWQFSVLNTNPITISDTTITLQTSETPGNPASWESLAEMNSGTSNAWTAQLNAVPAGNRYFRAVMSAPGCADSATAAIGPVNIQLALPPIDSLSIVPWAVNVGSGIYPLGTWSFVLHQLTFTTPGLQVHLQWSATPGNANSWSNLPGGGSMISFSQFGPNPSGTWQLDTTNLPVGGTIYFRATASAPGYLDSSTSAQGPYNITPLLPPQTDQITSDTIVALGNYAGANSGLDLHLHTTNCATLQLQVAGNTSVSSTLGLQGGRDCGGASLNIAANSQLTSGRTAIGTGATVENQGTINGTVLLIGQDGNGLIGQDGNGLIGQDGNGLIGQDGNGLIGQDGNGIVAQGGGNMTFSRSTAAIVAQGGGNIVAQGGGNIVAQGGGNIVAQGGGNIVAQGGGNVVTTPKGAIKPHTGGTQPTFTGRMIVNGDYHQFAGNLIIGIAGTNTLDNGAQQYDQLIVHGNANLVGGTIA